MKWDEVGLPQVTVDPLDYLGQIFGQGFSLHDEGPAQVPVKQRSHSIAYF